MTGYGVAPDWDETTEVPVPDWLETKLSQATVGADRPEMHSQIRQPASAIAIARQLNQKFAFGRGRPVRVFVAGYGWFLIGPDGWALDVAKS